MTRTPVVVPEQLRQRLAGRFSPAQLTELAAAIAWENHRGRLNRALGVRAMGFTWGAVCAVPEGLMGAEP
jgi:alkylhydroperoxidase family enzyme